MRNGNTIKGEYGIVNIQTTFSNIKDILLVLYSETRNDKSNGTIQAKNIELNTDELAKELGIDKVRRNNLQIMEELLLIKISKGKVDNLFDKEKEKVTLTSVGYWVADLIKKGNIEALRTEMERLIQKSSVLSFAYSMLKNNTSLSNEYIGREIAIKYAQNWEPETSDNVGRSIKDIFGGFGLIDYTNGNGVKKTLQEHREHVYTPTVSWTILWRLLKVIEYKKPKHIYDIAKEYGAEPASIDTKVLWMVNYNIAKKTEEHYFELTEKGQSLKEAKGTANEKTVFREILLDDKPTVNFLKYLHEEIKGETINLYRFDDLFHKYNASQAVSSKQVFGRYMRRYLTEAGILSLVDRGKYRLNPQYLPKEEITPSIEISGRMEDKSDIDTSLKNNFHEIVYTFGRADDSVNIQLLKDRLSKMRKIPEDALEQELQKAKHRLYNAILDIFEQLLNEGKLEEIRKIATLLEDSVSNNN